jgi:hypothetical protein
MAQPGHRQQRDHCAITRQRVHTAAGLGGDAAAAPNASGCARRWRNPYEHFFRAETDAKDLMPRD